MSPPTAPIITEVMRRIIITLEGVVYLISVRGANFCHLINNRQFVQFIPSMTSGIQKCKGAAPSLRASEVVIIEWDMSLIHCFWKESMMMAISRIIEANACTRKYFSADSVIRWLLVFEVRGRKDKRLISNPIQAPYHEVDDTETSDPTINVNKNINVLGLVSIRKRRINIKPSFVGYEPISFVSLSFFYTLV